MSDKRLLGDILSANAGYELRRDLEAIGTPDQTSGLFWVKRQMMLISS